jgi:hypothetical protein
VLLFVTLKVEPFIVLIHESGEIPRPVLRTQPPKHIATERRRCHDPIVSRERHITAPMISDFPNLRRRGIAGSARRERHLPVTTS